MSLLVIKMWRLVNIFVSHSTFLLLIERSPWYQTSRTCINIYWKCFWTQVIILSVFFHLFAFSFSDKVVLIFCIIGFLFLSISYFPGFINFVVGLFKEFSLWSFNVVKSLLVLLISILLKMFGSPASLTPCLFIFVNVFICFLIFWCDSVL